MYWHCTDDHICPIIPIISKLLQNLIITVRTLQLIINKLAPCFATLPSFLPPSVPASLIRSSFVSSLYSSASA